MFEKIQSLLNADFGEQLSRKLIGICTDSGSLNVGKVKVAVTMIEQVLPAGVYRVFCSGHQLDLAVQSALESRIKDSFQNLR